MINLTDTEKEVLKSVTIENSLDCFCYETAIYNYCDLDGSVARGCLSSMVQKGILKYWRDEWQNYFSVKKEYLEEVKKLIAL